MKYRDDDIVELTGETVDGEPVPIGAVGEILMVCPKNHYEALFRDAHGDVTWVSTITGDNLRLVQRLERTA